MKKLFLILLVTVIVCPLSAADPCIDCKTKPYPYIGCSTNPPPPTKTTKCMNDPLNPPSGFRIWKKCVLSPEIIDYISSDFPFEGGIVWSGQNIPSDQKDVINLDQTYTDIIFALYWWTQICLPNPISYGDCDSCRLKIIWARTEREMDGYPNSLAITSQKHLAMASGKCEVNCNTSYIAFNATNNFMRCNPDQGEFPAKGCFFYTNVKTHNKKDIGWYHFSSVITHEIGHWLGLGDVNQYCWTPGSSYEYTVMWNPIPPANERNLFTDVDKCMFMLLYCCDATNIQDPLYEKLVNLSIAPSPSLDEVNIMYYLPDNVSVSLNLYNIKGELIKTILDNAPEYQGERTIRFNTQQIPTGEYYYELKFNDIRVTKKSIIIH